MFSENFYEPLRSPLFNFICISIITLYIFQFSLQRLARTSPLIKDFYRTFNEERPKEEEDN